MGLEAPLLVPIHHDELETLGKTYNRSVSARVCVCHDSLALGLVYSGFLHYFCFDVSALSCARKGHYLPPSTAKGKNDFGLTTGSTTERLQCFSKV